MNTQNIPTRTRVLTNAPYRPQAHGKVGVVIAYNPHAQYGIYSVTLEGTDGLPYFYHEKELTPLA